MTPHDPLHSRSYPPETFTVTAQAWKCDVTPLIIDGAKLDVIINYVRKAWGVKYTPGKSNDWVYYAVYRAVDRWVKDGTASKLSKHIDTFYPGLTQKRGVFVVAKPHDNQKTARLINDLQKSNSFVSAQNGLILDEEQNRPAEIRHPLDRYDMIPGRCGFWRSHAIKLMRSIRDYSLFVRDKNGNLPAEMVKRLDRMGKVFEEWKQETESKSIVLLKDTGEYLTIPCATRFTDESRKKQLIYIYNHGVENSLKKYKIASFVTFTTDPLLWMSPEGKEITRKIPDPHIDKVHRFEGRGRGGNLYAANRHESNAFRKWYECECRRAGYRIPYLRVVEFTESSLIHDHIILFDYEWKYEFGDFARQWGSKYGQGYMHDAYTLRNDGEKWVWRNQKPNDAEGRDPTDYLKKYLIKALYSVDGHFPYWITNKRFFTLSNSVRYLDLKEEAEQKKFRREHAPTNSYEYVGVADRGHEYQTIEEDVYRRQGLRPPIRPATAPPATEEEIRNAPGYRPIDNRLMWYPVRKVLYPDEEDLENPDQGLEPIAPPTPPPDPDILAYDKAVAEDARLRKERRERLKQRSR